MDKPGVQTFSHVGNKNGTGSINFENDKGCIIATIEMTRHQDGLWYTTNPVLMPPTNNTPTTLTSTATCLEHPTIMKTATTHQPILSPIDKTTALHDTAILMEGDPKSIDSAIPTVMVTKLIEQLKIWHQRMGHPAPCALYETQRVVEGIPLLPRDSPIYDKCPFCDMAKLQKANRNKESLREVFIPGTSLHMDLGFICGPSNLEEVVKNGATPTKTIVKSHDGYEAYLLIIHAATQYIWIFLLKGKHLPIATIAQFLQKHGTAQTGSVTTTRGGLLHKSRSFEQNNNQRRPQLPRIMT
jgi:hypothetical protein